MMRWLPWIFLGVLLNTGAQLFLKHGSKSIQGVPLTCTNAATIVGEVGRNPLIWGGLALYVLSVFNWIIVLSRVDVSAAYPLMSLGYVLTAAWGWWVLGEGVDGWRIFGILLICSGTLCIARSGA